MVLRYCPRCPFFADRLVKVVNHMGIVHSCEANFTVFCGIGGCTNSYKQFASYKTHLYRRHRDLLVEDGSRLNSSGSTASAAGTKGDHEGTSSRERHLCEEDNAEHGDSACPDEDNERFNVKGSQFNDFKEEARTAIWNFFFNITEKHKLPHSVAKKVFSDLALVLDFILTAFASEIAGRMETSACTSEVQALLTPTSVVPQLFAGIDKKHQREEYARSHFSYVEPVEYTLGTAGARFHYIPVDKVLGHVCSVPDIAAHIKLPTSNQSPLLYRDFTDGLLYQEHFKSVIPDSTKNTIFIILYTDEIEIVNPLGPRRGTHKLVAVYFSVLNLHPRYRSQLRSIYLVLLAKEVHVKMYGLSVVLKPLITDLQQLKSDGMTFWKGGRLQHAQVFVFCVCGDNLSMNRFGGFSCCFSRGRVCRFCLALSSNLGDLTSETACCLWTATAHRGHLQAVEANPVVNKRLYGINERSPMLELGYFDVTRQLPPDIMHDILEGAFDVVLRQVLKSLIQDCVLSYGDLELVESFEYGHNDRKNKPGGVNKSFLAKNATLKGTASQKWCLLRLMPMIFGELVPEGNSDWELLLQFREIVDIVFASEIPSECLAFLDVTVQSFITEFAESYGGIVTPKMHYLVHYARFVREVGPLRQFWSMRFEAKHQYLKNLASKVKNFRNITKTLAKRHQMMLSYELENFTLYEGLSSSRGKAVETSKLPACVQEVVLGNSTHVVHHATIDHTEYRCGNVLVKASDDEPELYLTNSLYVSSGKLLIMVEQLTPERFNRHEFCICVHKSGKFKVMEPGDETPHCSLDFYEPGKVVMKWAVM